MVLNWATGEDKSLKRTAEPGLMFFLVHMGEEVERVTETATLRMASTRVGLAGSSLCRRKVSAYRYGHLAARALG